MSADFPWSVLGLAAPGDETEIRRAYARKLKVTRPDEDPEGFQVLVRAREIAMAIASGAITLHFVEEPTLPPAAPRDRQPELVLTEEAEEVERDAPEPSVIIRNPEIPEALPEAETSASDEEQTREKLRRQPAIWDMETWHDITTHIANLPFFGRQRIEQELIYAIAALNWEQVAHDRPFGAILLSLSEEYGWEHDSVKLVSLFEDAPQASSFHDLLRYIRDIADGKRSISDGQLSFAHERTSEAARTDGEKEKQGNSRTWFFIIAVFFTLVNLSRCASMNNSTKYSYDSLKPVMQTTTPEQREQRELREKAERILRNIQRPAPQN